MDAWWVQAWASVVSEFSDLPDAKRVARVATRLLDAIALGAMLGYEREKRGRAAGLRTHMLVALGAALFVIVPLEAGMPLADTSRVLQGLISGIGFLGAGAIIKLSQGREIKGVTTAASVWLTGAIGVSVGMGREATAALAAFLALCILLISHPRKDDGGED